VRVVALLAFAALVLAAGCGGGAGGGSEDFAKQANAICTDVESQIDEIDTPTTLDELADSTEEVQVIFEGGLDDMRQLEPPSEFQDEFDEFISLNEEKLAALGDLADAARAGDVAKVEQITDEGVKTEARSDKLARGFGAPACADD
jgi:hypothetical protein